MGHTAKSKLGKVLEGMWWWLDNDEALQTYLNEARHRGTAHMYRVFDGTNLLSAEVHANECPALLIDPVVNAPKVIESAGIHGHCDFTPYGLWTLRLVGYLNSVNFDETCQFSQLAMEALYRGVGTLFAVPSQGLLTGSDQIIEHLEPGDTIPAALWINPSEVADQAQRPSRISAFVHEFRLYLTEVIDGVG